MRPETGKKGTNFPRDQSVSLFVNDHELHRRVAAHMGVDSFKAAVKACEQDPSFPPVSALWRGRFFPAVEAWLFKNNGMMPDAAVGSNEQQDGLENFDAPPRRSPKRPR